jgi:multisubunit Na+/H+ antiporter MnhB subunit
MPGIFLGGCFLPEPQWGNVFIGAFTFYLVITSWMTVRRSEGSVGRFEYSAFIVALSVILAALVFGTMAANTPMFWLVRLRFAKRANRLTVSAQRPSVPSPPTTAY